MLTQKFFDLSRRTVAAVNPDYFRRRSKQERPAVEVSVLGDDHEIVLLRVSPDLKVVRGFQSDRANMHDRGAEIPHVFTQSRRKILVE